MSKKESNPPPKPTTPFQKGPGANVNPKPAIDYKPTPPPAPPKPKK